MINLEDVLKNQKPRATTKKLVVKKVYKESESTLQKRVLFYFEKNYRDKFPYCQIVVNPLSEAINSALYFFVKSESLREKILFKVYEIANSLGFKASQPDLLFLYPNKKYIGLAIEIKTLEANPYYAKDSTKLKKNKHTKPQQEYLDNLYASGYLALFGVGYEHCKEIIDNYFNNI